MTSIVRGVSTYVKDVSKNATVYEALLLGRGLIWDLQKVNQFLMSTVSTSARQEITREIHYDYPKFVTRLAQAADMQSDSQNALLQSVVDDMAQALNNLPQMCRAMAGARPISKTNPSPIVDVDRLPTHDTLTNRIQEVGIWRLMGELAASNLEDLLVFHTPETLPRIYAWTLQLQFFDLVPMELVVSLSDDLLRLSTVAERNMHIDQRLPVGIKSAITSNVHSSSIEASISLFAQVHQHRTRLVHDVKRDMQRLHHIEAQEAELKRRPTPDSRAVNLRQLQLRQSKDSLVSRASPLISPLIALNGRTIDIALYTRGAGFPNLDALMRAAIPRPDALANAPFILLQQWAQEGRNKLLARDAGYDGLRALEHARNLQVISTPDGSTYVAGLCAAALAGACPLHEIADEGRCERLAEAACRKDSAVPMLRAMYENCRNNPSPDDRSKCIEGKWATYVETDEGSEAVCRADVNVNYVPSRTQPSVDQVLQVGCNAAARRFGGDFAKCARTRTLNQCVTELVGKSELLRQGMKPSEQYCIGKLLSTETPPPLQSLLHPDSRPQTDPCAFATKPTVAQSIRETHSLCETCLAMAQECEALHPNEPRLASKACLAGWLKYCRANECPVANHAATHLVEEAQALLKDKNVQPHGMRQTLEQTYQTLYAQRPARLLLATLKALNDERSRTRKARDVDAQASEMQVALRDSHDDISTSGGVSADDLAQVDEVVLDFLKNRAPQMRSMQIANDILNAVERMRWVSAEKCRRTLMQHIRDGSDKTKRKNVELWCNATVPDANALKQDAQKASQVRKTEQLPRFRALLHHRRNERVLERLRTLVVRAGRSSSRFAFVSTGLFDNEELRAQWRTKQLVAEWYEMLRAVREPAGHMPLGTVPVSEAKSMEQIRQALDAQVLNLAMQLRLQPCTYHDTTQLEVPSTADAGLTAYGIQCASDEALLFMMHVRALVDARDTDAGTAEGDDDTSANPQPLVVHPSNLKAVYRNFAHEILQLDANRAMSQARIGVQRRDDVLSMSFIYDFCMDCVFRRDPKLTTAQRRWDGLAQTAHGTSTRELPLPSRQRLYLMRMACMCVPTSTRVQAVDLLQTYVALVITPLVMAVRKSVTVMKLSADADPKQVRRSVDHARNVTSLVDEAVGSRLTKKVDAVGQVIAQKRRAAASRKGVDAFRNLRVLNTPGETHAPTKGASLVAATVTMPALVHNLNKIVKVLSPMRKTHKKILPALSLVRNMAATGATLGTLHQVGAGAVVDGAMNLMRKARRSSSGGRPEDAGVEGLTDRQREFYDIQNVVSKFQAVNAEVYEEYSLFIQTAIVSFYLEADDGSVDPGGVTQMAELLLELVVHGEAPGQCDLYHDTELTPSLTPAISRMQLDKRLRSHGLVDQSLL
jgi:hypothetical protein